MVKFLIPLLAIQFIFLAWSVVPSDASYRIYNGSSIDIAKVPYQAWLGYRIQNEMTYGHLICGGSVITQRVVLTAAFCFDESYDFPEDFIFNQYIVVAGCNHIHQVDRNTQHFRIQKLVRHPDYKKWKWFFNNIALVFLNGFIPWDSPTVRAIALPSKGLMAETPCMLSGWGQLNDGYHPYELHQVPIVALTYDQCKGYTWFRTSQICSAGDFGCHSDVGGPLVCLNQLYGISFSASGCRQPTENIGLYTNVSDFVDWIRKVNSTFNYAAYLRSNSTQFWTSFNMQKSCFIALFIILLWAWIKRLT